MRIRYHRREHGITASVAAAGIVCVLALQAVPAVAADTTPPTTPTNLRGTSQSPTAISLAGNASTVDVAVTAYVVARNGSPLGIVKGNPPATSTTDSSVQARQTYTYKV